MAHIDPVNHLTTAELITIVQPAAEAWSTRQELVALLELIKRLERLERAK